MIVSFSHKFIFIKTIKTAGSSVEHALASICDHNIDVISPDESMDNSGQKIVRQGCNHMIGDKGVYNHMRYPELIMTGLISRDQFENDFHKIVICRNPWDQQVSSFWHYQTLNKAYEGLELDEIKPLYLNDFTRFIAEVCYSDHNAQRELYREFYFYENGVPYFNSLIKFENLEEDFYTICARLSLPTISLPRLKTNIRRLPGHYSRYYTESTKQMVAECYPEAIDFFGYTFQDEER